MRPHVRSSPALCAITAVALLTSAPTLPAQDSEPATARTGTPDATPSRIICWIADGDGMQPMGELEAFLVDGLGASGDRIAVDPGTAHAILKILGLAKRSTFDPQAARRLGVAAGADRVLWVKLIKRNVKSKKLISIPYLLNRRRLDARVFYDVRLYDVTGDAVIGSKQLRLSARGNGTWQIIEDEPLDPAYDNSPVEIHNRMRRLDWRAAAAISKYVAKL